MKNAFRPGGERIIREGEELKGFYLECNGKSYSDGCGVSVKEIARPALHRDGVEKTSATYLSLDRLVEVTDETVRFPGLHVVEKYVCVRNVSPGDVTVTRLDSVRMALPEGEYRLKYFTNSHGKEFTPEETLLTGTRILETTGGRSSIGTHPWFALEGRDGSILTGAVAWSGNWIVRFEPMPEGRYRITGGLSEWQFQKTLGPGEVLEGVHFVFVSLPQGDIDDASVELGRWGRKYWYPYNELAASAPIEWNCWYPYTDAFITEYIFKANVDKCAELGVDVCTLDAGWFGLPDTQSQWHFIRGDWHKVNTARFPSGIRALADYVHAKGMKFGIWCEIEGAGSQAELNALRPDLIATRAGGSLGYVCMGNPEAVRWAFGVLEKLILDYGADWIKIDFNLSPGAGCDRADHGHQSGDGLYEHYRGYYQLLDMIRAKYPNVLLENCSGGGLRTDLGIMRHMHLSFLSDPDYPPHALQVFWGTISLLHPSACLHWAWSQTTEGHKKNGDNNPIKADMPPAKFDYIIRTGLLKSPGFSHKYVDFPPWCLERLSRHIAFYKETLSAFVHQGDCHRLTGQSLRGGGGELWNAFLYVMENRLRAALLVFRQPGAENERLVRLKGLSPDAFYEFEYVDGQRRGRASGAQLMEDGILLSGLPEEGSEVILFGLADSCG